MPNAEQRAQQRSIQESAQTLYYNADRRPMDGPDFIGTFVCVFLIENLILLLVFCIELY